MIIRIELPVGDTTAEVFYLPEWCPAVDSGIRESPAVVVKSKEALKGKQ